MRGLKGKRVAFLATDMFEQVELVEPWNALHDAGADVELLSLESGEIQGFDHYDKADTFHVDGLVSEAKVDEYDALVLPGGVGNPDTLRMDDAAVRFVRDFVASGKPVAAICHGPWLLVEANAVRGRTVTSFPSLRTDVENAGGTWVDRQVAVDAGIVTSRKPGDLPACIDKVAEEIAEGLHRRTHVGSEAAAP